MIEIHLYGKLRRFAGDYIPVRDVVLALETGADETVESLLARAGIPLAEINHIFFNSKLLVTRSQSAPLFDFPQVSDQISQWDLAVAVNDGDRLGIFGMDIPILSM